MEMSVFLATKLFNRTAHVISNPIDAFFRFNLVRSREFSHIVTSRDGDG